MINKTVYLVSNFPSVFRNANVCSVGPGAHVPCHRAAAILVHENVDQTDPRFKAWWAECMLHRVPPGGCYIGTFNGKYHAGP